MIYKIHIVVQYFLSPCLNKIKVNLNLCPSLLLSGISPSAVVKESLTGSAMSRVTKFSRPNDTEEFHLLPWK